MSAHLPPVRVLITVQDMAPEDLVDGHNLGVEEMTQFDPPAP